MNTPVFANPTGEERYVKDDIRGRRVRLRPIHDLRRVYNFGRRDQMKLSRTGYENGASDTPMITPIDGVFLCPFGLTPNDMLQRHREALAGTSKDHATPIMKRGNYFQAGALEWFNDDYNAKVVEPTKGYRNEYCNLVASLDGVFTEDWQHGNHMIPAGSVWECKLPRFPAQRVDGIERVLQVQSQIDCANVEWGVIAELAQSDCIWRVEVIPRHQPTIDAIREAVDVFWAHMEDGTDYGPQTSSEASRMLLGNRMPDRLDLTDTPTTDIMCEARQNLIDASETYLSARSTKANCERMMEDCAMTMKTVMQDVERVKLPGDIQINHTSNDSDRRRFSVMEGKR